MSLPSNLPIIFDQLPVQQLLTVAKDIQQRLLTDTSLVSLKDKKEYVTKADYALQRIILDYFAQSALAGTYRVCSEEVIDQDQQEQVVNPAWELVLDPLDGTTAFCQQQDTWGVMVGACDLNGQLLYSWNLVSTGEVYSTNSAQSKRIDPSNTALTTVDVYDYGVTDGTQRFPEQTSYPSAVWAGWQLYQGKLDGLIWLPSEAGKKAYPDYDLIFLGALEAQGWQVFRGKMNSVVQTVAVARNKANLDQLLALV